MFLLHGEAKYIDVLERSLYNGVISGVSLDGKRSSTSIRWNPTAAHSAAAWFGCACCPPNICRFLASLPGYVYAVRGNALYTNLYVGGKAAVKIGDSKVKHRSGNAISVGRRNQNHPRSRASRPTFALKLRIPGWAGRSARAERFVPLFG